MPIVKDPAGVIVVDAPEGTVGMVAERLADVEAVVLLGNEMADLAGLLALLHGVSEARMRPFSVIHDLADERTPALVEAWQRGWRPSHGVHLDGVMPGQSLQVGPFLLKTSRLGMRMGLRLLGTDGQVAFDSSEERLRWQ
jgi:hypothetical protein